MNDVVELILKTYQSMCPLDTERAADSRQKISRYIETLASAGQRDAEQLNDIRLGVFDRTTRGARSSVHRVLIAGPRAASLHAGRPGFSAAARERRGENPIGGRAFASIPCQRFHHWTNHSVGRRVADNCHRDCPALYFGSLRWDRRKRSSPAPGSLPGPTPALRTSSTERPPLQRA